MAARQTFEPAAWQGPALTAQLVPAAPNVPAPNVPPPNPGPTPPAIPNNNISPPTTAPPATINVIAPPAAAPPNVVTPPVPINVLPPQVHGSELPPPASTESPLLDGKLPPEELMPPVVQEGSCEESGEKGVRPYGGGHPTDWSWGCGGSPYRNGPGMCDNWKVGCRWHVTVDGIVMHREPTDLVALAGAMPANFPANVASGIPANTDPSFEQFDHGPGGRVTFTSQVARCTCYDIQAVFEGVDDWNASIVYPKQAFTPTFFSPVRTTTATTSTATTTVGTAPNTTTTTTTVTSSSTAFAPGPIPLQPPAPFPEGFIERSLHYRSDLNSGELNFLHGCDMEWRPFCGVRYIRFDDEISDFIDQQVQPPLPFAGGVTTAGQFLAVAETDHLNVVHADNNLMGFQIGLAHDTVRLNDRLAIEGFINGGVYYNRIKYSNVSAVQTTQVIADDTSTTGFNEARVDPSNAIINDSRDLSEISYEAEASLTGVCRLNKCWSLRAGYQVLWINHLHLADAAYLGDAEASSDLLFHGWHAGIECRR